MNKSINYMISRIEELINIVIDEQKVKSQLKYEALRSQINPHFLFNTLNIIKWSAKMSGANNVSKMISSLGILLETSMNKGDDEISFKEELELIKAYMFIQNVRYNDAFLLKINIPEEILNFKVLKFILQPIVENSIIHGFKNLKAENIISIKAEKAESYIKLTINDNGQGIEDKILQKIINDVEANDIKKKYSSIGLKNIADRIKLKYGNQYTLEIESLRDEGTTVLLTLPIIK
jgi:two-component system sensor histidine kinase YesM